MNEQIKPYIKQKIQEEIALPHSSELDQNYEGKIRFLKAIEYEKTGDYMLAMQEYATLAYGIPPFRPALLNLGSLYSRMKYFDDALQCYQRAVEIEEDYLSWFNIGSILYRQNNFKQSVIALEKAKRLNGKFPLSILVMALSYRRLSNSKAAEQCFKDVLTISPNNEVALTGLTLLFFDLGKFHQSLEMVEHIILLKPANNSIRKLRSNILYKLGRSSESAIEIKALRDNDIGYRNFDDFAESIPFDSYDDKFGTLDSKIAILEGKIKENETPENLMALSFCYLFKGESDKAIDVLFKVNGSKG